MSKGSNYEKWFTSTGNRDRLRSVLNDPVFKAAVETLLFNSQPDSIHAIGQPDQSVQRYAWLAGYNQFLRDLNNLADISLTPPSFDGEEWNYPEVQ